MRGVRVFTVCDISGCVPASKTVKSVNEHKVCQFHAISAHDGQPPQLHPHISGLYQLTQQMICMPVFGNQLQS